MTESARLLKVLFSLCGIALPVCCQTAGQETLSGGDSHELSRADTRYLFGDWGGERGRLEELGVDFDLQYISDSLWNLKSEQPSRAAIFNRVRGTVDIDLGRLIHHEGWYFHATALWQGGDNMGTYLGLITAPSGLASANTFRLDSWWIEKRWLDERVVMRAGQFAGQDFYGTQYDAASFIFEPLGYALGNLSNTFESFDPPSTPAAELRVAPLRWLYVKSMVLAASPDSFSYNPTGLVPSFRGALMSVSEVGVAPGKKASSVRATGNVEGRKGYSGLYQFGAAYNPARFNNPVGDLQRRGNYLLYWMANQALWRVDRQQSKGLDATLAYDWSPSDVNSNNRELTAGLRFNEPLPVHVHNTISFGYVRNSLSRLFLPAGAPSWKAEHGFELNSLFQVTPILLLQPVIQFFENPGGRPGGTIVFGFRTKIEL
jgi:carbohydrate-selective porin OprB